MNYNDYLRTKLHKNLMISLILFAIAFVVLLIKLYQIFFTDMLDIQYVLILKDYIPIFFAIQGLLAVLTSYILKLKFDSLYPHQQVQAFFFFGILFFPFNGYLIYLGFEKYKEKGKFIKSMIFSIALGLLLLIPITTQSYAYAKDINPVYLNEYVIEGIYQIDGENYVTMKVTGITRGSELQSITYEALMTFDAPNLTVVGTEFIQISMNVKQTCIVYAFTEAQNDYEMTCTIDEFTEEGNRAYTLDDFTQFEDLYVEIGQIDLNFIMSATHKGPMTITNRTFEENVYNKYN